jgi:hypothetical protein
MNRWEEFHKQARELFDRALIARDSSLATSVELFRKAFELERTAVSLLQDNKSSEPTRSTLYQSAASMAVECGEFEIAKELALEGLTGNPPKEIRAQLNDLLQAMQSAQGLEDTKETALSPTDADPNRRDGKETSEVTANTNISEAYLDEFGPIEPEVYNAAKRLWPQAEQLARHLLGETGVDWTFMIKSAALVTRAWSKNTTKIQNLNAYLFQTYKRLVLAELEKSNGHRRSEVDLAYMKELEISEESDAIDQKILISQITSRLDAWTKAVFEYRILGFKFKEIGKFLGKKGHAVEKTYNERLRRLGKQIESEKRGGREKSPLDD